jgi:hypothetical protein
MARQVLTPQQEHVLRTILRIGQQRGASPKQVKAAVETGLVESNLSNPSGGTSDSAGWRQERASLYADPTNLAASVNRFFDETGAVKDQYARAGDLAAAVQRPAAQYRGRYQDRSGEASGLLAGSPAASAAQAPASTTRTTPGVDRSGERKALILQWLQTQHQPGALVSLASGLQGAQDTPGHTVTVTRHAGSTPSSQHAGTASFDGKPVAAWIKPLLDYARQKGWKGTVTSGVRTDAEQTAIYKSGVRPAAVPRSMGGAGSNHERTGFLQGAIDVTDPQTLSGILKTKNSRLRYAGAKDPVHFSVPRNGSY